MPIHPAVAVRLSLLEGIRSFREAFADPVQHRQIQEFDSWEAAPGLPTVNTWADSASSAHGAVPVRVYVPTNEPSSARAALVWMHGGGFVGGDLDMREADWTAREISERADAVVVSVDYRLASNGVTYPVPHDDVVAAVAWTRDRAEKLGVDPTRISIGGASAGANLAAGAALRLRDRDAWLPASLALIYPMLHPLLPLASPSLALALREVPPVMRFSPEDSAALATNYLGGPPSSADGYAMPGLGDVTGLCPTLVLNAEYDDLRASGQAFAASLALAGVDVRQVTLEGMLHGFLNLPAHIEPVRRCLDLMADLVRETPA